VRDRVSGLGAPLIGVGRPEAEQGRLARRWPATLFLRFNGRLEDWAGTGLGASLELYSTHEVATVEVSGRPVALEADFTAPLAHGLKDGRVWALGIVQLLTGEERVRSNIYLTEPYQRGKIPVVFVHGTASSPAYWAEMWNTLRSDPVVRGRFQFWNFVYNSANPVGDSAARLRAEIERKLRQLDPDGKDAALRQMVVVGHSQGGLLAELTAKDTGDALWRAVSTKDFGELDLPESELEEVRRRYFFTAMPSVRRVVFISTPHRGSHLASSFVRSVAIRVIRLPADVVRSSARLLALRDPLGLRPEHERRVPSSLDDMSPRNPWLLALADIPTAPGVAAHSIVAIRGRQSPPNGGDGVVSYDSAHVAYARSEFVVRSGHSCQRRSDVIEEVRRILMEHMAESAVEGGPRSRRSDPR
jgi:pimeloyl-ACP methyl ester carboxylesterase